MSTKTVAKKVLKKKRSRNASAAKRLPKVSSRAATRGVPAEPPDDQSSADAAEPHERVEPRELSHERLQNLPEETGSLAPDDDLVDDVAADADALESGAAEEDDGA